MELINYLKNLWSETITPTIKSSWDKADKRTDRLIESVRDDISINNPNDISNPIVEAQNSTIEAIKNIHRVDIPKTVLISLEQKLDTINKTLQENKMEVNVGETKLELKPVIQAIEKIKLEVPKMERQEVIDYTLLLDEICVILEKPKDFTEIKKVQELLKPISKTEDIAKVCEYIQVLIDKPIAEFPEIPMHRGRIKVEVDRIGGGGGGGLTSVESEALQGVAKESKQDALITQVGDLVGFEIPAYDYIALTYVAAGNGAGEIETVVYKTGGVGGTTVATLTLGYDASNNLTRVAKL